MAVKLVTTEVRFSYAHVFEAKAINEGDDAKFSVSILISKKDKKLVTSFEKAIQDAISEDAKGKNKLKGAKKIKTPLRDGDEESDEAAYEGHFFLSANSKDRPMIVDENRQEIIDPREFYSGCYGRASLNFYAFDTRGNKGIAVALNSIQKLRDGDSLGGGYTKASLEEDFGDGEEDFTS